MLVIASAALVVDVRQGNFPPSVAEARVRAENATEAPRAVQGPPAAARAVFPYSVVAGGVHSVQELRSAIAHDPIVAEHYKDFDLSKAHVMRLAVTRDAYVSYRIGSRIYWTRKTLVLPAGERVITDGRLIARTRCGNQVADRPGATSAAEPSPTVLDTPIDLPDVTAAVGFAVLPTSPDTLLPSRTVAGVVGAVGPTTSGALPDAGREVEGSTLTYDSGSPGSPSLPDIPVPVPEPGSLTLMATGALLIVRKLRTRRPN